MKPIRVVVYGASGRMGQEVLAALCHNPGIEPVAAIEQQVYKDYLPLPNGSGQIPFSSDLQSVLSHSHPDVLVDFTNAKATMLAVRTAIRHKVRLVIGTTGLSHTDLNEIEELCRRNQVGAVVCSNFSLGAVLMIHLAKIASRFFDHAEIIEMHHEQKADAPSGTAITTAKEMVRARGKPFQHNPSQMESLANSRGALFEGIALHSLRLPGLLAHQKVVLGGPGQTLSIRHDAISRQSFMPGLILAIKEVVRLKGLVTGLDSLLGL